MGTELRRVTVTATKTRMGLLPMRVRFLDVAEESGCGPVGLFFFQKYLFEHLRLPFRNRQNDTQRTQPIIRGSFKWLQRDRLPIPIRASNKAIAVMLVRQELMLVTGFEDNQPRCGIEHCVHRANPRSPFAEVELAAAIQIGRASCRER